MRICSNCFGVIYLSDWECGCGRQNKGMGVDQQLLKPLDVEQKLKADGWRRCAEGQGETQHCALLEAAVLAEREACANILTSKIARYEQFAKEYAQRGEYDEVSAILSTMRKLSECANAIRSRGQE